MEILINESRLDLACGDSKREGFKGIDIAKTESVDYVVDLLQFPWPIESDSAEEIHCSHFIEHIPHLNINSALKNSTSFDEFKSNMLESKDTAIEFFNELYRIMKVGAKAYIIAPYYSSMRAYGDPTHKRYIADFSFFYLNKEWRDANKLSHYGLDCDFDIKFSYQITNEMTLKSDEVRNKAFNHDWNVVDDIIVEIIKR